MLIYIILFIPLLLAFFSYFMNKKHSKKILKMTPIFYIFLFLYTVYLFKNWIVLENQFFILNYSKSINNSNLLNINILFFSLILLISAIILKYSQFYFKKEIDHKAIWLARLKEFNVLANLFILAMLIVASTKNIVVMWIALEATTIFTTFLISFYGTKTSWEASWKYVILCSVGLTVWLFWIILLITSGLSSLDFTHINFENVNILWAKLSFLLILIWFGTKVWLFPMHTWLPDAHGKAATPVSALMSSILLPLAIYIIIRNKIIVDIMIWNPDFTNQVLLFFWLITVFYAWFVMIVQKHFKRALAFSSSENMWIILVWFWLFTPLSIKLAILHITVHSFFKAASFMSVWNILVEQDTGQFNKISNIWKNMKVSSILMVISLLLLVWLPISPLFLSEIWIISILFSKNILLGLIFTFSLILVFIWLLKNFGKMFENKENKETKFIDEKLKCNTIFIPIILSIILGISSIYVLFI